MSNRKTTRELACRMTAPEKAVKSDQLVAALQDKDALEDRKKASADEFKSLITDKDRAIKKLTREVATGVEYREVDCGEVLVFARNQVDLVRLDTGEVVDSRTMRPEERQEAMDFAGPSDDEQDEADNDDAAEQAH